MSTDNELVTVLQLELKQAFLRVWKLSYVKDVICDIDRSVKHDLLPAVITEVRTNRQLNASMQQLRRIVVANENDTIACASLVRAHTDAESSLSKCIKGAQDMRDGDFGDSSGVSALVVAIAAVRDTIKAEHDPETPMREETSGTTAAALQEQLKQAFVTISQLKYLWNKIRNVGSCVLDDDFQLLIEKNAKLGANVEYFKSIANAKLDETNAWVLVACDGRPQTDAEVYLSELIQAAQGFGANERLESETESILLEVNPHIRDLERIMKQEQHQAEPEKYAVAKIDAILSAFRAKPVPVAAEIAIAVNSKMPVNSLAQRRLRPVVKQKVISAFVKSRMRGKAKIDITVLFDFKEDARVYLGGGVQGMVYMVPFLGGTTETGELYAAVKLNANPLQHSTCWVPHSTFQETRIGSLLNFIVEEKVSPHFVWIYDEVSINKRSERTKEGPKEFHSATIMETTDRSVMHVLSESPGHRRAAFEAGHMKIVLLQLIQGLLAARYQYGFRHNDCHCGNIFLEDVTRGTKMNYKLGDKCYSITSAVCVRIGDFGLSTANVMAENEFATAMSTPKLCQNVGYYLFTDWYSEQVKLESNKYAGIPFVLHDLLTFIISCKHEVKTSRHIVPTYKTAIEEVLNDALECMKAVGDINAVIDSKVMKNAGEIEAKMIRTGLDVSYNWDTAVRNVDKDPKRGCEAFEAVFKACIAKWMEVASSTFEVSSDTSDAYDYRKVMSFDTEGMVKYDLFFDSGRNGRPKLYKHK
jgi:hypothetical protein